VPRIVFVQHDGISRAVEVSIGQSLMEGAICNRVPGIMARCGGAGGCATCQVYIGAGWQSLLQPPSRDEMRTLRFAYAPDSRSRLACQIRVTQGLDGLVLRLPLRQF
jgi:2Fe-2S ferredoxin